MQVTNRSPDSKELDNSILWKLKGTEFCYETPKNYMSKYTHDKAVVVATRGTEQSFLLYLDKTSGDMSDLDFGDASRETIEKITDSSEQKPHRELIDKGEYRDSDRHIYYALLTGKEEVLGNVYFFTAFERLNAYPEYIFTIISQITSEFYSDSVLDDLLGIAQSVRKYEKGDFKK